jgi:hypothetical protein
MTKGFYNSFQSHVNRFISPRGQSPFLSVPNQEKASKIFIRTFESFYFCIQGTSRA